jgi:hypothetical protein
LPLNVWFTRGNIKGPKPDRDAHVIESKYNARLSQLCRSSQCISTTYPAAAISAKSLSVIHVLQC